MSLATQVSALATAVGAKLKAAAPITKHAVEMFGFYPLSSSAQQNILTGSTYYFGTVTYGNDATAGTAAGSTSTWALLGHWSGTYSFAFYYAKLTNTGIVRLEWSKNGGTTWATLVDALDTYAATNTSSVLLLTGLVIPEGSDVQLRVTVTGKTGSQYYYTISGWELMRTGP